MLARFRSLHDRLTKAGFALAASFVAVMTLSFWYEVVARYFFGAPTSWAYAVASYALCPLIFLSLPAMTQRGAHISMTYLVDRLPASSAVLLARALLLLAALVCLVCAWVSAAESWRQYVQAVETISGFPVPKWWVSAFIPYGMLSSSLYFLRQCAGDRPTPVVQAEVQL